MRGRAEEDLGPGSGRKRHAEAAQAGAAQIAMVPNDRPEDARREDGVEHDENGVTEMVAERVVADVGEARCGQDFRDEHREPR